MAEKIALQGFSRLKLFPIINNSAEEYSVDLDNSFYVPWAQEMTREADTAESKIYADDTLYLNVKNWNGMKSTITVAELTLEMMSKLGFGSYNSDEHTISWNPQGENLAFGVTFRCLQTNGKYRMMRMYVFTIDEIKETAVKTKGDSVSINSYQLIGTFTNRLYDDRPGEIHDGDDMDWLDTIPIAV